MSSNSVKLGRNAMASTAAAALVLAGCAGNEGYRQAFSDRAALKGNSHEVGATPAQAFRAAQLTLVRQGFTIDNLDSANGTIKAIRNLQDPSDSNVSYTIPTSVTVTPSNADGTASLVSLSASQQTVLHREWHTWFHLLWLIPLFPTGTEYQTVTTAEGNVTDPAFYKGFFVGLDKNLGALPSSSSAAASPASATAAPSAPVADAAVGTVAAPSTMPAAAESTTTNAASAPVTAPTSSATP